MTDIEQDDVGRDGPCDEGRWAEIAKNPPRKKPKDHDISAELIALFSMLVAGGGLWVISLLLS